MCSRSRCLRCATVNTVRGYCKPQRHRLSGQTDRRSRIDRLGLHPGGGHTWMMRRLVGAQTAAATVLFGEVLDGEAAERHGLAWRCGQV